MKKIKKILIKLVSCFIVNKQKRRSFRDKHIPKKMKNIYEGLSIQHPVELKNILSIGKSSYIGRFTFIHDNFNSWNNPIKIGSFCSIARDVKVALPEHPIENLTTHPLSYSDNFFINSNEYKLMRKSTIKRKNDPVEKHSTLIKNEVFFHNIIGHDVWIGANSCILSNVNIGNGAVVGAGSIVTKDVPPYAIVAGVPAKIIKYRFNEETIKQLEELKWWELSNEEISTLDFQDIKYTLKKLKEIRKNKKEP